MWPIQLKTDTDLMQLVCLMSSLTALLKIRVNGKLGVWAVLCGTSSVWGGGVWVDRNLITQNESAVFGSLRINVDVAWSSTSEVSVSLSSVKSVRDFYKRWSSNVWKAKLKEHMTRQTSCSYIHRVFHVSHRNRNGVQAHNAVGEIWDHLYL